MAKSGRKKFSKKKKGGLPRGAKKTVKKKQGKTAGHTALPPALKALINVVVVRTHHKTKRKLSEFVNVVVDSNLLESRLLDTQQQVVPPNEVKGFHNAEPHPEHGAVTYLQQIHQGGFAVRVGDPTKPDERFFGPGCWVAFTDADGPGHASQVGPEGVQRTLRLLKGTRLVNLNDNVPRLVTSTGERI